MTLTEQSVTIRGKTVHYWEAGINRPRGLMLLHGMADAQSNWASVMPALADQFHVFAPDLPGFGKSAALGRTTTASLLVWLKQLIEGLEFEQMGLVGHSLGALLVRLFSAAYPQSTPAIVMVNGGTIPNVPNQLRLVGRLPIVGSSVFYGVARSTMSNPAQFVVNPESMTSEFAAQTQTNLSGFAGLMRMFVTHPLPEKHTPGVPTLLMWGAADSVTTLDEAERIKAAIPGSQLSPIAECGHLPQLEAQDVFTWQIEQFLDNLNRPSKSSLPGVGRLRG
jgi:pimeloyl-ACP methyl ester carboxylesterase